jgi:hypothetical protein
VNRCAVDGGSEREIHMKKLFILALLGLAGFAVWRKVEADRAEQALWAEVTDPVD